MTYPPTPEQPGYSGQFDPWNPSAQHGYHGQGGAPGDEETTRQLPAIGFEPQQGTGFPPPRKRTGLVVGIALAALAVVGGGVALLLALTGDDDETSIAAPPHSATRSVPSDASPTSSSSAASSAPSSSAPPSSSASSPAGGPGDAHSPTSDADDTDADLAALQGVADQLIDGLNAQDVDALVEVACTPNPGAFPDLPEELEWSLAGEVTVDGDQGSVPVQASYQGTTESITFAATKTGDGWCLAA